MKWIVTTCGEIRAIYTEDVALTSLGRAVIRRASQVEPDSAGLWHADLGPVGGPTLGPFDHRSEALAAEVRWLEDHDLPVPVCPVDR